MSKSWEHAIIVFLITFAIGMFGVYQYRNHLIVQTIQLGLYSPDNPVDKLKLEDFDSVEEYSKAYAETAAIYEEMLFKYVAEEYWSTPEQVKKLYMNHVLKETSN